MYRIETESETTIWWQCSLATATATACNSPKSQRNEIDHFPTISVCCLSSASQHLTPPSSRRLVSTLGQAVQSLNESRRGGKKTQLPTGQWAEALLDLYVLLCKCYKRILITSPDQDRHTDRPRQWDCETERQFDSRLATRCLNSIGATTETEAPDAPSRQDAPDAPPFTMDWSIQQSTMTRPFSLCSAIDIASCEIKRI